MKNLHGPIIARSYFLLPLRAVCFCCFFFVDFTEGLDDQGAGPLRFFALDLAEEGLLGLFAAGLPVREIPSSTSS